MVKYNPWASFTTLSYICQLYPIYVYFYPEKEKSLQYGKKLQTNTA